MRCVQTYRPTMQCSSKTLCQMFKLSATGAGEARLDTYRQACIVGLLSWAPAGMGKR